MAIHAVSRVPLNAFPAFLPIPEPGTSPAAFLSRWPERLPIPEAANREASALNLLPPVSHGVTPGGAPTRAFNEGAPGPAPGPSVSLPASPSANFPTYGTPQALGLPAALHEIGPDPGEAPASPASGPPGAATSPREAGAVTATPATPSAAVAPQEPDPMPGMLQVAYRAPLVAQLAPLASLRGAPRPAETEPLRVEATRPIRPLDDQGHRQAFLFNPFARKTPESEAYLAQARWEGPPSDRRLRSRPALDLLA